MTPGSILDHDDFDDDDDFLMEDDGDDFSESIDGDAGLGEDDDFDALNPETEPDDWDEDDFESNEGHLPNWLD